MHVLTDNQGQPLNGTNSFDEPITYAVTRFHHDGTLAVMAVYDNEQGDVETYPLSINLAAYGYYPMPAHTFIDNTYLNTIKPLIEQEYLRIDDTIRYGTFNATATDIEFLIPDIETRADENCEDW
ncbi:hypothetical protein BAQU_1986 [Bifidobacterium aquikefiri]|uniref:Uncharacterized protein n=1 Tax=Bifidobacterium aquikefiri TaxID=1653207 RepID=A0A261G073_9BIFI|nr:hypothetical protein [Bifidobacterium aquikefiri]OZG64844.1 hypothetical protein BAQU_1986 [Bifidobacterium aquikefiri]